MRLSILTLPFVALTLTLGCAGPPDETINIEQLQQDVQDLKAMDCLTTAEVALMLQDYAQVADLQHATSFTPGGIYEEVVGQEELESFESVGHIGPEGAVGPEGPFGVACWDLNGDGIGNITNEDSNNDGVVDVLDCRADSLALEARIAALEPFIQQLDPVISVAGSTVMFTGDIEVGGNVSAVLRLTGNNLFVSSAVQGGLFLTGTAPFTTSNNSDPIDTITQFQPVRGKTYLVNIPIVTSGTLDDRGSTWLLHWSPQVDRCIVQELAQIGISQQLYCSGSGVVSVSGGTGTWAGDLNWVRL